jgi:hypothetical protein
MKRFFLSAALVSLFVLGLGAITGARARSLSADEPSGCVAAADGAFCLCKADVDVCAGEQRVAACAAPVAGACFVSPVGFCYCTTAPDGPAPGERRVDRCAP